MTSPCLTFTGRVFQATRISRLSAGLKTIHSVSFFPSHWTGVATRARGLSPETGDTKFRDPHFSGSHFRVSSLGP